MKVVNKPLRKKDAMQLVTGQPVYMDDVIPEGCLCVKLLRSPHANAIVESINTAAAMKVPGMERIFTWEDVPQDGRRYTQARLIPRRVRMTVWSSTAMSALSATSLRLSQARTKSAWTRRCG